MMTEEEEVEVEEEEKACGQREEIGHSDAGSLREQSDMERI